MRYLIDTHVFIWWIQDNVKLSGKAREIISEKSNCILVSVASFWEMAIKIPLGKLSLRDHSLDYIHNQILKNDFQLLSIGLNHAWSLQELPLLHKDPFDRVLIAQSRIEKTPIISHDQQFSLYEVDVVW